MVVRLFATAVSLSSLPEAYDDQRWLPLRGVRHSIRTLVVGHARRPPSSEHCSHGGLSPCYQTPRPSEAATATRHPRSLSSLPVYGFRVGEGVTRDVGGREGVIIGLGGRVGVTRGVGFGPCPQFTAASRWEE